MRQLRGVFVLVAVLAAAGCTSSGGHRHPTVSPTSQLAAPTTSESSGATVPSVAPSMAAATACAGLAYCDDFSDTSTGWVDGSTANYLLGYSSFGGGSYHVLSRGRGVLYQEAPVDVSRFAPNDAVRIDTDVTPSASTAGDLVVGLRCWGHPARDGSQAGFSAYVYSDRVELTVRGDNGTTIGLTTQLLPGGLLAPERRAHLALVCLQTGEAGAAEADIALALNGTTVVETTYGHASGDVPWSVGPHVGVLVGEQGGDVYFDNFGVSHVTS
jgi:hypothetical protein